MRRIIWAVMLCGFAISAFAQADAVKEALLKADRDFNQATQQHRLDGWMQFMDDYGVVDRGKPVVGKDDIRAELKEDWDNPDFHLTWEPDEAYAFPNHRSGYTRGHWTLNTKDKEGKSFTLTGQYLTIWRQNKQGEWKIIWDGGSADPPKQ